MSKDQIQFIGDSTESKAHENEHASAWDVVRAAAFGPARNVDLKDINWDSARGAALGGVLLSGNEHGRHNGKVDTPYGQLALGTTLTAAGLYSVLRIQNPVAKVIGAAAIMGGLAIDGISLKSST